MSIIVQEEKNQITRYLLGQLDEADEEKVELRLLSDPAFNEEFDIVVDEISIRYVAGEFEGKEKERIERYFLRAPKRQDKVKVISELLHHTGTARAKEPVAKEKPADADGGSGFFGRALRFWTAQPLLPRIAVPLAAVVIVVGIAFLMRSGRPTPPNYATLTLNATDPERGGASDEVKSVRFPPGADELRIQLLVTPQQTEPKTYRAEFIRPMTSRSLTVVSRDAQSVLLTVPTADLKPDRYGIRLFAIHADGREERIPGTYVFRVE